MRSYTKHAHFGLRYNSPLICDMIKGNESDVRNIDFELQAERCDKFLCFTLFLKEQPDVLLRWGLDQNVAFLMNKWFIKKSKLNIADVWLIPLDPVTFIGRTGIFGITCPPVCVLQCWYIWQTNTKALWILLFTGMMPPGMGRGMGPGMEPPIGRGMPPQGMRGKRKLKGHWTSITSSPNFFPKKLRFLYHLKGWHG